MRSKLLTILTLLSMGLAIALLPMGGNPAHAGPVFKQYSSPHKSGKLRATTNAQRKAAAERAKARRAAAAAAAAPQNTQGGAK
jgi:hypothetical protein